MSAHPPAKKLWTLTQEVFLPVNIITRVETSCNYYGERSFYFL